MMEITSYWVKKDEASWSVLEVASEYELMALTEGSSVSVHTLRKSEARAGSQLLSFIRRVTGMLLLK